MAAVRLPFLCERQRIMGQYELSDFAPTSFKFGSRVRLVSVAARLAMRTYSAIAERDHGVRDAIKIDDQCLASFVKKYFENVARFKLRHDYRPGERINQPKIAGLLLKSLSDEKWENFFTRHAKGLSDDFMEKMFYEFAYQLMCGVLFIDDGVMPDELIRDFYICMYQKQFMSDEWACWTMASVLKAYGREDAGTEE